MPFSTEKALKHSVVMLSGNEHELRRRALSELLAAAVEGDDDFDREEFDAGSSESIEWVSFAGTAPFLGDRRVVVVRHLLRSDPDEAKLMGLPATALLILVADDETGDENKQRTLLNVRSKWEAQAKKAGGFLENFATESKNLTSSVKVEAGALGKKLSDQAATTLTEMTGASLSRAIDELQKLAIFVGNKPEIREADVRAVVVPSREWNVFKLVDSLLSGESGEALRQLRILVGSQVKAEEAAMRNILPQASRNLRLIWQARLCVDAKVSLENASATVTDMFPEKHNLLKEKPWVQTKIMRLARCVDLCQLSKCLQIVSDTDARLKGMMDSFTPMDSLERMVLEMAQVVATPLARR